MFAEGVYCSLAVKQFLFGNDLCTSSDLPMPTSYHQPVPQDATGYVCMTGTPLACGRATDSHQNNVLFLLTTVQYLPGMPTAVRC